MAPKKRARRLVTQRLTVNRAALRALSRSGILSQRELSSIAGKVVRQYKARYRREIKAGETIKDAKALALSGKRLMVQRVQNAAVYELTQMVKSEYSGELARWLPSSANVADPLHQLNYGQVFIIGVGINGEEPGDRYGCECGMEILVDEDTLEL